MAFGLILLATLIGFGTGVILLVTGSSILLAIVGFYTVSFMVVAGLMLLPSIRADHRTDHQTTKSRYTLPVEL